MGYHCYDHLSGTSALSHLEHQKLKQNIRSQVTNFDYNRAFFHQFGEKVPGQNWQKMIDLTSKLEEIKDIEHNKGSKIYPKNQVILDCIMSSIPLKHKCLSIILIWVVVYSKHMYFFLFGLTDNNMF